MEKQIESILHKVNKFGQDVTAKQIETWKKVHHLCTIEETETQYIAYSSIEQGNDVCGGR